MTDSNQEKYIIFKHILVSLTIYSIFFFIAAYYKPFHVDEFYSWVYSERCSLYDITTLRKQFGIGHPPLYHLIQKLVQNVFPSYHHIQIRLANYFFGFLFIILFAKFTLKQKNIPYFIYGIAGSATILEIFVFSRMWGLVCLASMLLLWAGEEYCKDKNKKYLFFFLGSCILGFLSDYSFIILSLYFIIVLFWQTTFSKNVIRFSFIFMFIAFAISPYWSDDINNLNIFYVLSGQIRKLVLLVAKTINVLFNFWFVELLLTALLLFGATLMLELYRRIRQQKPNSTFSFTYLSAATSFLKEKAGHLLDVRHDYSRVFLTVIAAWLITLAVNPVFWAETIRKRFLTILLPFILYIIVRHFDKKSLYVLASLLFCSGLIYISSNRVAGIYPPPSFDDEAPIIYQNEWAYTTQHLRSTEKPSEPPFITDFSSIRKNCRICRMGTKDIPFDQFDTLWTVWSHRSDPDHFIPAEFKKVEGGMPNFTWLDRMQFKYLTPLPKDRYLVYKYVRQK